MNCAQARFLLYAYLDRDISGSEAQALAQHLAECPSCEARSRSARGLVRVLKSRVERSPAPVRLRQRLHQGAVSPAQFKYPLAATAALVLFLLVPLVADVADVAGPREPGSPLTLASLGTVLPAGSASAAAPAGRVAETDLVTRHMSGTLVCLDCEARSEAGLCPLPHAHHEPAFCADNGEVWRLMSRDPSFTQRSAGQTLTVEGVTFPRSGFLRASRVGY